MNDYVLGFRDAPCIYIEHLNIEFSNFAKNTWNVGGGRKLPRASYGGI